MLQEFPHDPLEGLDQLDVEFVVGEPGTARQLDRRRDPREHVDLASRGLRASRREERGSVSGRPISRAAWPPLASLCNKDSSAAADHSP